MRPVTRISAALGILLAATACGTFDPQPDPNRFFLMTAVPDAHQGSTALEGISIGIGPVWIAPYADQQKLVTRVEPNRVEFAEYERWAESFRTHLIRIVGQEVQNLTGADALYLYPWAGIGNVDLAVELTVFRFERTAAGGAEMELDWQIRLGGTSADPVFVRRDAVLTEPAVGTGENGAIRTEDSVLAMSNMVGRLTSQIAEELVRARGQLPTDSSP